MSANPPAGRSGASAATAADAADPMAMMQQFFSFFAHGMAELPDDMRAAMEAQMAGLSLHSSASEAGTTSTDGWNADDDANIDEIDQMLRAQEMQRLFEKHNITNEDERNEIMMSLEHGEEHFDELGDEELFDVSEDFCEPTISVPSAAVMASYAHEGYGGHFGRVEPGVDATALLQKQKAAVAGDDDEFAPVTYSAPSATKLAMVDKIRARIAATSTSSAPAPAPMPVLASETTLDSTKKWLSATATPFVPRVPAAPAAPAPAAPAPAAPAPAPAPAPIDDEFAPIAYGSKSA